MIDPHRMPLIWALDIATVTGCAIGRVNEKPHAQSVRFAPPHESDAKLFHGCLEWWSRRLEAGPIPDILALEELLPPTARRGETNTGAQHRLAGLHGIILAHAVRAGIPEIVRASVQDIRQHFIHHRNLRSIEAKRAVLRMCEMLGWDVADNNCSDALALWSYTAALIDPLTALEVTPLFGKSWVDIAQSREAKRG